MIPYKRLYSLLLLLICCLLTARHLEAQSIVYVDSSIVSSGNGSSWGLSFKTLQEALDAAETVAQPVQIWVKKGTYYPTAYPKNCTDYASVKDKTFLLAGKIAIYGGFAGTETTLQQRNTGINPTIFSGDIGVAGDTADNCRHIVTILNNADTVMLDGLTFTRADANDNTLPGYITVNGTQVATTSGGGVYNWYSPLKVNDCQFLHNDGYQSVGIFNYHGFAGVSRCNFLYNSTTSVVAPGVANHYSTGYVLHCLFRYNNGMGCVYNLYSNPEVSYCFFTNNTAVSSVGMLNYASSPIVNNCVFAYNTAVYRGANTGGGMSNVYGSAPQVINCTFAYNSCNTYGGGLYSQASFPVVSNCVFWGNTAQDGPSIYCDQASIPSISYSIVQGGYAGVANKDLYPFFTNTVDPDGVDNIWGTADDGLQVKCNSPALNMGDNIAASKWSKDIAGNDRVLNTTVDAGAYESLYSGTTPTVSIDTWPDRSFCAGTNVYFTATPSKAGDAPSFQWRVNDISVNNATDTYADSSLEDGDKVSVIITSSEGECITNLTATSNVLVRVYDIPAAPEITAIGTTSFCEDSSVVLTVPAARAYMWSNNAITRQVKATTSGVYHVRILSEDGCWSPQSNDTTVTAVPLPVFTITSDKGTTLTRGASTQLTATTTTGTIAWTPVSSLDQPASFTTIASPDSTTTYKATVSSLPGCATSHSITIRVIAPEIDTTIIITANKILTPNGDGINDYLVIDHIESYPNNLLQVFDRAGKLVYQQRNYHNEWNGIVNGRPFVTDAYFYVFSVKGKVVKKASITVVK